MKINIYVLLISLLWLGCKNNTTSNQESSASVQTMKQLEGFPTPIIDELVGTCTQIDYIFYDTNFSMSTSGLEECRKSLANISLQVPVLSANCKSNGKVFFNNEQGKEIISADIYIGDGCDYLVFLVDGIPNFANKFTPDGAKLFRNIIKSRVK